MGSGGVLCGRAIMADEKRASVLFTDMGGQRQQEVINICYAALTNGGSDQEIAQKVKEEVEKKEEGAWHVIVGRDYAARCTHEQSSLIALDISIPLSDAPHRRQRQVMVFRHG